MYTDLCSAMTRRNMMMGNANLQTGSFPHRVRSCAATNSPSNSGHGSRPSCRTVLITAKQATPLTIPVRSSMASSGFSIPAPRGVTFPNATGPGRRSSRPSIVGVRTAPGSGSPPRCWTNSTTKARSTTISGVSMPPLFGPAVRRPEPKKKCQPPAAVGWAKDGANARAVRPCAGTFPGRFWHEDPSGL
jgi:hypothetical protein